MPSAVEVTTAILNRRELCMVSSSGRNCTTGSPFAKWKYLATNANALNMKLAYTSYRVQTCLLRISLLSPWSTEVILTHFDRPVAFDCVVNGDRVESTLKWSHAYKEQNKLICRAECEISPALAPIKMSSGAIFRFPHNCNYRFPITKWRKH